MLITMIIFMLSLTFTKFTILSNSFMMMDNLSISMIFLSFMTLLLIMLSSSKFNNIFLTTNLITFILFMTFSMNSPFTFYIMFELSLIPTFILITKYGKQPERLQAGLYLIMYMIIASLPLLYIIINMSLNKFSLSNMFLLNSPFTIFIILAFLIKMPMFLTHLWLPKAHVEAPLEGSMILAAILLKLGGYGLIRFIPLIIHKINIINSYLIAISLTGAISSSINCFRQKDLKALVAYSSVSHMALIISSLMTFNMFSLPGAIMMMIAHGLTSSSLFFLVDNMYNKFHSRTTTIFKGMIHIIPNITFWWFMSIMINMSAPPTINTLSEILMMSSILSWNPMSMIPLILTSMMITSFSVMMFIILNHNLNYNNKINQMPLKNHLSMFIHLIPTSLLIMKSDLMFY